MMSKGKPFTKNDPQINKTGRKKTYPQEVIDFISDNSGAMSDKELSAAINKRFNFSTTRQSIKSLRRYYNIGKGREKYKACPVLTEKIKDGYVIIKKSNDAIPAKNNWIAKHRYLWEQANGKVPKGYIVIFLDYNRLNFDLDNLAIITKEDQIRLTKSQLRFNDPELTQTGIAIVKHKALIARRVNAKKIFINITNTRSLLAAVIKRALDDLRQNYEPYRVMTFILSETCKEYCLFLKIDYEALKNRAMMYNAESYYEKRKFKKIERVKKILQF